jgi:hypothetical protein
LATIGGGEISAGDHKTSAPPPPVRLATVPVEADPADVVLAVGAQNVTGCPARTGAGVPMTRPGRAGVVRGKATVRPPGMHGAPSLGLDLAKLLEDAGWRLDRQVGSHRQFAAHPDR